MGPIFLHWGGKTDSYCNVLCHRNSKLAFPSGLYVGSDEEKSSKMPSTNHKPLNLLYTKHLKDNGRRYLTKIVVGRRKGRLFKSNFGHDGLIVMIRFLLNKNSPIWIVFLSNFRNNFQKRLKPLQYDHVLPPLQNDTLNKLFSNNNFESLACKQNKAIEQLETTKAS